VAAPQSAAQHFYNVYAYCRWADDLGDEVPEGARALDLLRWWERELDACYEGKPSHPVFVALRETVVAKDIPKQPFADLLKAFRQDQTVKRYSNWDARTRLLRQFRKPVGRFWCCISAAIAMKSASGCPTLPARRCNSQISGRMSRETLISDASTFHSMPPLHKALRERTSSNDASMNATSV